MIQPSGVLKIPARHLVMFNKISNWSQTNLMSNYSRGINLMKDFNQCITLHFQHIITYSTAIIENSIVSPIEIEFAWNLFPWDDKRENQYVQNFQYVF